MAAADDARRVMAPPTDDLLVMPSIGFAKALKLLGAMVDNECGSEVTLFDGSAWHCLQSDHGSRICLLSVACFLHPRSRCHGVSPFGKLI